MDHASSPIVVWPLTMTCASSFVRAPIVDVLADDAVRPDLDALADASRRDGRWRSGWITGAASSRRWRTRDGSAEIENISSPLHAVLPSTVASSVDPADVELGADDARFHVEPVARHDRAAEFHFVDAGEIRRLARHVAGLQIAVPPSCASASIMYTPGSSGLPGKCPVNIGSFAVTFL